MIGTEQFTLIIGFFLIAISAITEDERQKAAFAVFGLIAVFFALGFFNIWLMAPIFTPILLMLFGFLSFYTKGTEQLVSVLLTIMAFTQL